MTRSGQLRIFLISRKPNCNVFTKKGGTQPILPRLLSILEKIQIIRSPGIRFPKIVFWGDKKENELFEKLVFLGTS